MTDITIRCVERSDRSLFERLADDVFDDPINPAWLDEFLADPRHHMAIALADNVIVGMASAVHYLHPDKAPELWINEVAVASTYRQMGLAKAMIGKLLDHGKTLGCREAWVLTESANAAARALYRSARGQESESVMVSFDLEQGKIR